MKRLLNSRYIPLIVSFFLLFVFALWITDFVRSVVVMPLLYLAWLGAIIFKSLPHAFFWAVFILAAVIIAARSFSKKEDEPTFRKRMGGSYRSPIEGWARLIKNADEGEYSRWQLAQALNRLTWEMMGYKDRPSIQQMEAILKDNDSEIPEDILDYFQAGLQPYYPKSVPRFLSRYRFRRSQTPLNLEPGRVIQFLEERFDHQTGGSL
jgi:hypothetical protein